MSVFSCRWMRACCAIGPCKPARCSCPAASKLCAGRVPSTPTAHTPAVEHEGMARNTCTMLPAYLPCSSELQSQQTVCVLSRPLAPSNAHLSVPTAQWVRPLLRASAPGFGRRMWLLAAAHAPLLRGLARLLPPLRPWPLLLVLGLLMRLVGLRLRPRLLLLLGQAVVVAGLLVVQHRRRPQPLHLHLQPAAAGHPGPLVLLAPLALLLC